jgi:hypothetical protein
MALGKSLAKSHMIVIESFKHNGQQNYHGQKVNGCWWDYLNCEVYNLLID